MPQKVAFISIKVTEEDGIFLAQSPELPGLNLCGKSIQAIEADIGPMIERFYSVAHGLEVRTARAVDAKSFEAPPSNGESLRYWAAQLEATVA